MANTSTPIDDGSSSASSSPAVANVQVAVLQPIYFLLLLHSETSTLYYVNDPLGTPRLLLDESGHVAWQGNYHPFGQVDMAVGQVVSDFRFPGRRYDAETGLHYNGLRYYDPDTGRYVTTDPIGLAGGINPYLYTEADPVNGIDPWGLFNTRPMVLKRMPVNPFSEKHTHRNRLNKCPKIPPKKCTENGPYTDHKGNEWEKDNWFSSAYYHGGLLHGYKTWRNPKTGSQCTYTRDGQLIDSGKYMGTYDYKSPFRDGTKQHYQYDVLPHEWNPHYAPGLTETY